MYNIEILDIKENDLEYRKYEEYKLNEKEIYYIGDKSNRSKIGIIKNKFEEIKFVFSFNYIGLLPQILFIQEEKLIFLGAYNRVLCINEDNYKVLKQINFFEDIFFEFIKLEKKILIIFEMSIYMINNRGNLIWCYEAPDVIIDYQIKNNKLKVEFFDLNYNCIILLDTGKMK